MLICIGPLCGKCGNGTTVTVLRLQCEKDCDGYTIFYATVILGTFVKFVTNFSSLDKYLHSFNYVCSTVVIVAALLASVRIGLPFPNSLRGIMFYIQVSNNE